MVELLSPNGAENGVNPSNENEETVPAKASPGRKPATSASAKASPRSTTSSANDMATPKSNDKENTRIADAEAKKLKLSGGDASPEQRR